ncbi:MAG: discoidin domain-containing protein, partial [Victivallales bacterium]|nr:discoidin domain-containing protein [Victivallales bacterium]
VPTVIPGSTQKPHVKSKPVTVRGLTLSASHDDGNIPKNVLDGNPETRWSASGEKEWIGFDFGKPRRIEAVRMAWYSGANRSTSFQIETSADGKTWQLARKANSSGKTADLETYALGKTQSTRYLRVVCFGNTSNLWNSITELDFIPPLGK